MNLTPTIIYNILYSEFGNLHWWPIDSEYHKKYSSDSRFEVIVGAILTQNTTWLNVEKALENLKSNKMLNINNLSNCDIESLCKLIRPAGFFNQKANRLKNLATYLDKKYNCDLDCFFNREYTIIKNELLSFNGIGHETADSIILYAGNYPTFVIDSYTKRISERLDICNYKNYEEIKNFFENDISKNFPNTIITKIYNELHSLIVNLAKNFCRKKPRCNNCPLEKYCNYLDKLS